jgi:fibronectin-binding autotransporter adhesin
MRPNFWNPKNRVVYILFPCFLLFSQVLSAQTIYSRATGNWQNTNTWSTVGHSGATCNCTPGPSDVVAIASGHVVTFLSGNTATVSSLSISGTLTLGSGTNATGLTVTGAVIVNTGATLSSGGSTNEHTLTIGGNITNNGSISLTSAVHKLVLNGNTDRTISGTGSTFTVHNFDLATIGSSNIALQRNLQINGTLNFTNNGLIILNTSANLTLGTTAAFGAGGNAPGGSKYIVVDESSASNGQLIKLNGNNVNHWRLLYPIGTVTGGYNPLDLSLSTIAPAPTNNSSLAIKAIYNQSIPGQLRRSFRLTVSGNAQATTLTNANFAYSSTTDVSTGDALPSYTLIRYTNTSGVTSIVNGTAPGSGSFTAPSAAITLNNGSHFFTIGSSAVWYSYQDGNWSNWEVWTQDPSGTSLINPLAQIPLPGDQIVILNGFTVTANLDDRVLSNTTIEGGAVLDMGTRLNNNLGVVEGSGWLRINGVNLPAGTYTTFVGNGGGTIEYYNTSGTLPTGQTTYNNLVLSNSTNASIVFTNLNNLTVNGNIEISQTSGSGTVTWRINDNTNTSRTISLNGNLTVSAQGRIRAGTGNRTSTTQHSLTILGSIINNGSIKFFDDTDATLSDANFTSGTIYTAALRGNAVNVTFAGTGNQTVTADC